MLIVVKGSSLPQNEAFVGKFPRFLWQKKGSSPDFYDKKREVPQFFKIQYFWFRELPLKKYFVLKNKREVPPKFTKF
jgi:hypothetical protein